MNVPKGYKNWLDVYKHHKQEVDNNRSFIVIGSGAYSTGIIALSALQELISLFPDKHTVNSTVRSKDLNPPDTVYNQNGLLTRISEFLY
jgi:hypothetical protein